MADNNNNREEEYLYTVRNCNCPFVMYTIMDSPENESRPNTNNHPADTSARRNEPSDNRRQFYNINTPILLVQHCFCSQSGTINDAFGDDFFLYGRDYIESLQNEFNLLSREIITNSQNHPHNLRRNEDNMDYDIFGNGRIGNFPWPDMNPMHNYIRPSTYTSSFFNNNDTNNAPRTESRRQSRSTKVQFGYVPPRSGSVSSIESDQMSLSSSSNHSDEFDSYE